MTRDEALNIALPKWPQCNISGKAISKEQALEIIRRTDRFFNGSYGNNREFNEKAWKACHMPTDMSSSTYWEDLEKWRKKWGVVETEYIFNSWISCCWVGGVHGWCHPDGTIGFRNNIGKWPEVSDVISDFEILGREFPFLNLTVSLMDNEEDEATCTLVSMTLKDGKVEIINPIPIENIEPVGIPFSLNIYQAKENYFDILQLKKWAEKVYGA